MKYERLFQREPWLENNAIEEDREKAAQDEHAAGQPLRRPISRRSSAIPSFWTILGYAIALCLATYLIYDKQHTKNDWPHLKTPSPPIPGLNPPTKPRTLPITDWPTHPASLYRQPPSPAVDAEWKRISNVHNLALTSAQVTSLGKDPTQTVKLPPSWGFGADAHLGLITVLHQTHCLDKLRHAVYYDHYFRRGKGWGRLPPDEERARYFTHLDHCLHFLLETVTCVADTSVTTYHWMENRTLPVADFQAKGQCRDFEALVSWHAENHVDAKVSKEEERLWRDFRPREDDVVLPRVPATGNEFWDVAILVGPEDA
ncbi:hypothetical protein M409DRAFT_26621 [Zasmidium cellare ATCC 36951]|uniref:Tat pathway signal sequence n=1 Tax=Zasmidium cellare ATCC 36951 TaxID=1080233 RepID=A0A6A6CAC0_ZASCE|nr:uncharacterized protein M409DRAFT_26621 [Zasmidium cellare ATCC 36951]KAF2163178.1 hypothetical protein M409DRAFT_26621 [Zasmidium cellare ATCC 36951]